MNEAAIATATRRTPTEWSSRRARLWMPLLGSLVLLAGACGGGAALSEEAAATIAVAEQNQGNLNLSDDLASTELLDGNSGAITSLTEVVTGDRPILVWYWAPD